MPVMILIRHVDGYAVCPEEGRFVMGMLDTYYVCTQRSD